MADISRGEIVIFLERDRLYLDSGGAILSLNFPANIVSDLDVKNKESLTNLVATFIQGAKLEPSQIFFVVSEAACFSKDFPIKASTDVSKVEVDSQNFIDAVPFNSALFKIYKTPSVYRAVATNEELVDTIVDVFTERGFGLTAVVPANIYPEYGTARALTQDFAKHIIDTSDKAKISSMVGEKAAHEDQGDGGSPEVTTSTAKAPRSKLLPILIPSFAVLLIILVIVIVMRR